MVGQLIRCVAPLLGLLLLAAASVAGLMLTTDVVVTELKEIKHHYNQGVAAQKGIEY